MKDVYFIQYYGKNPWYDTFPKYHFRNGFSQTYKSLKNKGDFIWVNEKDEIPIDKGTLYISVWFVEIIPSIIKKAKENPNLEIHIGGPAFSKYEGNIEHVKNLHVHSIITVEELFNLEYDKNAWGLDIPSGFDNIGYNVSIEAGVGCIWGKCNYCKRVGRSENYTSLTRTDIPIIDYDSNKYIWLNTSCINPDDLSTIFLKLPYRDDLFIGTYIRGDNLMLKALQKNLPLMKTNTQHLTFSMGVEIPSNRMLKYINKGTTVKSLKNNLSLIASYGIHLNLTLMLGFNNFTWDDVKEIQDFFEDLKNTVDLSKIHVTLYKLMILKDRPIYKNPPGKLIKWNKWDSHLKVPDIYKCNLQGEQKVINDTLRSYYKSLNFEIFNDGYDKYDDLRSVKMLGFNRKK